MKINNVDASINVQLNRINHLMDSANSFYEKLKLGFEAYGESIYDEGEYKRLITEFREIKYFLINYHIEFWRLKVIIEKSDLPEEDKEANNANASRLCANFETLKNSLNELLLKRYLDDKISEIVSTEYVDDVRKISLKVKGIPEELFDCVEHKNIKISKINPEVDDGFLYEVYSILYCINDDTIDAIQKLCTYIDSITKFMLEDYDYCTSIYLDFECKLYNQISKLSNCMQYEPEKDANEDEFKKWQDEAFLVWEKNDYQGIFKVATGCGKTIFAIKCIQRILEQGIYIKVRIIVPSLAIANQWHEELMHCLNLGSESIGRMYSNIQETGKQFTIYTDKSAQKHFPDNINTDIYHNNHKIGNEEKIYEFIVADECHNYGSEENIKMLKSLEIIKLSEECGRYFSIGLSATPERAIREETELIEKYIGKVIYEYDLIRAIGSELLKAPIIDDIICNFIEKEKKQFINERSILLFFAIANSSLLQRFFPKHWWGILMST